MIKFKADHPDLIPVRQTSFSAGYDLKSNDNVVIRPQEAAIIPTGVYIDMPSHYVGLLSIRSSLAANHNLSLLNGPGIIDADYEWEVKAILFNHGGMDYYVERFDRIVQAVFMEYKTSDSLPVVNKRTGGFGSTNEAT